MTGSPDVERSSIPFLGIKIVLNAQSARWPNTANAMLMQMLSNIWMCSCTMKSASKCSSIITGNAKGLGSKVDQVHMRKSRSSKSLKHKPLHLYNATFTCPTHEPSWTQGWKNNIFASTCIHQFQQKNECPASLESGLLRVISLPHSGEALERLENCKKNIRALGIYKNSQHSSLFLSVPRISTR